MAAVPPQEPFVSVLETFLVVMTEAVLVVLLASVSRDQGCCETSYNAQDIPYNKNLSCSKCQWCMVGKFALSLVIFVCSEEIFLNPKVIEILLSCCLKVLLFYL